MNKVVADYIYWFYHKIDMNRKYVRQNTMIHVIRERIRNYNDDKIDSK